MNACLQFELTVDGIRMETFSSDLTDVFRLNFKNKSILLVTLYTGIGFQMPIKIKFENITMLDRLVIAGGRNLHYIDLQNIKSVPYFFIIVNINWDVEQVKIIVVDVNSQICTISTA